MLQPLLGAFVALLIRQLLPGGLRRRGPRVGAI